ncbi:MAG TPA: cellulose synthase operon protein YhjQ/BcsQ [Acidobacteriaceae bacterium]
MDRIETETIDETQSENPEDVAVLYSWAKLQGTKYRDFSASRRAYRAQMRHRAAELQRETERRAQLEAEATAEATEKAAREAEDAARFHDSEARRAALAAKQGESVIEEAASARAMRTASELARRAAAERVEAARRAEAVAAAEAAARREELEMAEAHASAQRQARQYYEPDARRKVADATQPTGGTTLDPYTADAAQTRPDRMVHQGNLPEDDMQPMRYRQSRDSGRHVIAQSDPAHRADPGARLEREAEIAGARSAAAMAEKNGDVQFYSPRPAEPAKARDRRVQEATEQELTGQERRVYDQRAHDRESQTTEREPWFPERIQMSRETEEMSPERASYATGSEVMRDAYAARVAAAPAVRTHSGLRTPVVREPDPLGYAEPKAAPRAGFRPEPRTDVPLEPNALSMVEIDGVLQPDRRRKPRPDFSNLPLRDYRPEPEMEMNGADENDPGVPAWIYGDTPRPEAKRPSQPGSPVDDTLQHTRERVASRWFALKGVFDQGAADTEEGQQRAREMRAPLATVFSLAGGVGKTSLIATLGRALSSTGERVLLTDTTSHGLLPFYFGASELRPGAVRTFSPPAGSSDAPIYMVSYDVNQRTGDVESQEWLDDELTKNSRNMQRVLVDLTPGAAWVARRLARMDSTMLVPVAPDMNSVISLAGVEKFFAGMVDSDGRPVQPFYVLNQFDASLALHLDVREVLRQQLGDRLLPFAIRRSPAVSEALAEGMTVIDYAPDSAVAGDYMNVVAWLRAQVAPAAADFRSARWSERSDR